MFRTLCDEGLLSAGSAAARKRGIAGVREPAPCPPAPRAGRA